MRVQKFAFGWALHVSGSDDADAVEAKLLKAFPKEMAVKRSIEKRALPGLGFLLAPSQNHKSKPKRNRPGQ